MGMRHLGILAIAGTLAAAPSVAEACSCVMPTLSGSWHQASDTFRGRVVDRRTAGDMYQYRVEVQRTFGGCLDRGDVVIVESQRSSAACGMELRAGQSYLLTADRSDSGDVLAITLCGYNREWSTLSTDDLDFLASRPVTCDEQLVACADGTPPVHCFADACAIEPWCAEAESCEMNTCRGCDAEFYDATWAPVCQP
jgi:hypothetical protein